MNCPHCNAPIQATDVHCSLCGGAIASRADPLLGQLIHGEFRILRKLGEGGFGAVYEAEQLMLQRKVAVKTLHRHLSSSPNIAARFRREGIVASRLTHPSAVKIMSFGETPDGLIWLAMEFIEGKSLREQLTAQRSMAAQDVVGLLSSLCEVLEEAHQKGVVHRDLKPENIMLAPLTGGRVLVKVLDFGIASLVEDPSITKTGVISGTPAYMPPEQWKGLRHTDARTDIYALGVIAYQCLSGALPFEADSAPEWLTKHCFEPPAPLQDRVGGALIPASLMAAIMKALEKEPKDRQQSALQVKQELEAALLPGAVPMSFASSIASTPTLPAKPAPTPALSYAQPEKIAPAAPQKNKKLRWLLAPLLLLAALLAANWLRASPEDNRRACQRGDFESCQVSCESNDPDSCLRLGHLYYQGQGAPQDIPGAVDLYQRACGLGSFSACYIAAPMYQIGLVGVQVDAPRGKALERAAAQKAECDQRRADSCLALSRFFSEGKNVAPNLELSKKFAAQACQLGERAACL
jgi:eukaryotic-like serine/threonine-protein kinase